MQRTEKPGEAKLVRMTAELMRRIADWRQEQMDLPTEAETIRRLIEAGLEAMERDRRGSLGRIGRASPV
jgi:hypothetical protein